jgi:multidrug efflux pump subunit AcrA (membrane-fusion protein)
MYVNVAFATLGGAESMVAVVPANAVQNINNQQVVFVAVNEANVFSMRPVRLGPEASGRYPVLEGVSVGDRIVIDGSFLLRAEWLKSHPSQ